MRISGSFARMRSVIRCQRPCQAHSGGLRGARDAIANRGVDEIPSLLQTLHQRADTYRIKLGIVVALTEMLRKTPSAAAEIEPLLTDPDLELLISLAGDSDRTVRIYATEFLYDLNSPRVTRLALSRVDDEASIDAKYNWLFLSQGGWRLLAEDERETLFTPLENAWSQVGANNPKTRAFIEQYHPSAQR